MTELEIMRESRNQWRDLAREFAKLAQETQAKLDNIMLEHCPDEMTPEQKAVWASHQKEYK